MNTFVQLYDQILLESYKEFDKIPNYYKDQQVVTWKEVADSILYNSNSETDDGWIISPEGKIIHCGYEGHAPSMAYHCNTERYDEIRNSGVFPANILYTMGWIRIASYAGYGEVEFEYNVDTISSNNLIILSNIENKIKEESPVNNINWKVSRTTYKNEGSR